MTLTHPQANCIGSKKDKQKAKLSKSFKYVPNAWKPKQDQKHGPGDYEIARLLTVADDKNKGRKRIVNIPTLERPKYGLIQKVRVLHTCSLTSTSDCRINLSARPSPALTSRS